MQREELPLLGCAVDGGDVYEIREGVGDPVSIWRADSGVWHRIGYATAYEVKMACAGHVPNIRVGTQGARRLAGRHFRLRQAIGDLVRKPDPKTVIELKAAP